MLLRKRLLWFLVLVTIIWGAVMNIELSGYVLQPGVFGPSVLDQDRCQHSTGVMGDLELARDTRCFSNLIAPYGDWSETISIDRNTNLKLADLNTRFDFGFIVLYWLTFLFLALYYWPVASSTGTGSGAFVRILACVVAVVITVAAIYDIRENILLFRAFPKVAQGHLDFALSCPVSRVKCVCWESLRFFSGYSHFEKQGVL